MYLLPIVKLLGSKMGVRLLLLLIVGLGALYTMHLLAQDFSKLAAGTQAGELRYKFKEIPVILKENSVQLLVRYSGKGTWTKLITD